MLAAPDSDVGQEPGWARSVLNVDFFINIERMQPMEPMVTEEVEMRISKDEEQVLRLMTILARQGRRQTLSELAAQEVYSEASIAKIMGRLREAGLVTAVLGRDGGYQLATSPEKISIDVILGALKRPLIASCATLQTCDEGPACPHDGDCGLRPLLVALQEQAQGLLNQVMLSDLVRPKARVKRLLAASRMV